MKKENIAAMIMGLAGGILFAIGMVLALLPEWGMIRPGIAMGAPGLVILLAIYPVWRKLAGKEPLHLDGRSVLAYIIGMIGTLAFGIGMCFCMQNPTPYRMVLGMVIGLLGLVVDIVNYPIYRAVRK